MIYTFYSFKGGVGRSMALANVAELLYRCGLKVLIVDFDLEAPGLEHFFDVPKAINKPSDVLTKSGLIDLLVTYKKLNGLPLPFNDGISEDSEKKYSLSNPVPPLNNFIVPIYKKQVTGGSLEIIPSGKRIQEEGDSNKDYLNDYAQTVRSFDWDNFYRKYEGENFFDWFRHEAESCADIVLIDSRTGITEMGGICTHQLADVVVMILGTNEQNIDGAKMVAESLTNPKLIKESRNNRKLSLLFVPSRVEKSESDLVNNFFQKLDEQRLNKFISPDLQFEKENLFVDLMIPYIPRYAFLETIIDQDKIPVSDTDLYDAYKRLTFTLMQLVPKDNSFYDQSLDVIGEVLRSNYPSKFQISNMEKRAESYQSKGLYSKAEELYLEILERKKQFYKYESLEVTITLEVLAELYESQGRFSEAESLFREAKEITRKLSSKSGWEEITG